jgi:hypothetical protein
MTGHWSSPTGRSLLRSLARAGRLYRPLFAVAARTSFTQAVAGALRWREVTDERARTESVIAELNRTLGERFGIVLRPVGWDTDTYPAFGADPQALINVPRIQSTGYLVVLQFSACFARYSREARTE